MKTEYKYYIVGGIMLAVMTFLGMKAFAKPKTAAAAPPAKKRTGSIIIEDLGGEFITPSELTTRIGTRLRAKPNTDSTIIHVYPVPTTLLVKAEDNDQADGKWYEVFDKKGRAGWVRADVVDIKE